MSRKNWSKEEELELKRQIDQGTEPVNLRLPGRTLGAIKMKMLLKGWKPLNRVGRWKREELETLKTKADEGVLPKNIKIPGRTSFAVEAMFYALGYKQRRDTWTAAEDERLKDLLGAGNPLYAVTVSNKSYDDIVSRAKELGLVNDSSWTADEIESLRSQISAGKEISEFNIPGRTPGAIRRMAKKKFGKKGKKSRRWTKEELQSLETQFSTNPDAITITGRTCEAIRHQLQLKGLIEKVPKKAYMIGEVKLLRRLVVRLGMSAGQILASKEYGIFFSGRSKDSISQIIRRHGMVKPASNGRAPRSGKG